MRVLRAILVISVLSVAPLRAADQPETFSHAVDRIIEQEHDEIAALKQYSPLVETYIQQLRLDKDLGTTAPDGDKYFLGRAILSKGIYLEPLGAGEKKGRGLMAGLSSVFTTK